jgi:hypothetical protein
MQRFICDHCRKEAPPEAGYEPPLWYTLYQRYDPSGKTPRLITEAVHLCSPACLVAFMLTADHAAQDTLPICDECGAQADGVSDKHGTACSLHPSNIGLPL